MATWVYSVEYRSRASRLLRRGHRPRGAFSRERATFATRKAATHAVTDLLSERDVCGPWRLYGDNEAALHEMGPWWHVVTRREDG